jgi:TIR domain
MAQCTAPVLGHIRGGGADCPVHGYQYRRGYGGYGSYGGSAYSSPSYSPSAYTAPTPRRYSSYASRSSGGGGGGGSRSGSSRARRSAVTYSSAEYQTLNPVREQVVRVAQIYPDRRDLFLCHAWDDRKGAALDLYNVLVGLAVKVWFSEKDVPLGTPLLRQIDRGLANSRAAVVLVTPALLKSLQSEGIADKELSVLLATNRVIPVAHGTTFEALRDVSPMLASRAGLDTADSSLEDVATKVADVALLAEE